MHWEMGLEAGLVSSVTRVSLVHGRWSAVGLLSSLTASCCFLFSLDGSLFPFPAEAQFWELLLGPCRCRFTLQEAIPANGARGESSGPVTLCSLESVFCACLPWGSSCSVSNSFRPWEWPFVGAWMVSLVVCLWRCQRKMCWCGGQLCWTWRSSQCQWPWRRKFGSSNSQPWCYQESMGWWKLGLVQACVGKSLLFKKLMYKCIC